MTKNSSRRAYWPRWTPPPNTTSQLNEQAQALGSFLLEMRNAADSQKNRAVDVEVLTGLIDRCLHFVDQSMDQLPPSTTAATSQAPLASDDEQQEHGSKQRDADSGRGDALDRWHTAVQAALHACDFSLLLLEFRFPEPDAEQIPICLRAAVGLMTAVHLSTAADFSEGENIAKKAIELYLSGPGLDAHDHSLQWGLVLLASMVELRGKHHGDPDVADGFYLPRVLKRNIRSRFYKKRFDLTNEFFVRNLQRIEELFAHVRDSGTGCNPDGGNEGKDITWCPWWSSEGVDGLRTAKPQRDLVVAPVPEPEGSAWSIIPRSEHRKTPFVGASRCKALAELPVQPVPPKIYHPSGLTELHIAASKGDVWQVARLISNTVDLPESLVAVARLNDVIGGKLLDVDVHEGEGSTPLHYAAWYGQMGVVQLLVEAGADLRATSIRYQTQTPRTWAKIKGFEDVEAYLRQKELELDASKDSEKTV